MPTRIGLHPKTQEELSVNVIRTEPMLDLVAKIVALLIGQIAVQAIQLMMGVEQVRTVRSRECHLFAIVATDMLASGAMKPTIVFVGVAAKERVAMQLMEVGHHGLPVLLVVAEGQCIGIVIARIRLVAGVLASVPVLRRAIRRRVRRNRKCRVGKVIF